MPIQWSDSLAIHVPVIDRQHRELIQRVNALLEAMARGEGKHEIQRTMAFLKSYVVSHFGAEEVLMGRSGYPGSASHKREHADFIRTVSALEQKLASQGETLSLVMETQRLLGDWLVRHIGNVDQQLGEHLHATGLAAE